MTSPAEGRNRRRRLPPHERERHILDAATVFFAEHGFSKQTRQLADEIGVSQALIFRYFGTKDQLVDRIYKKVFISRWNPEWVPRLEDRSLPLAERLRDFALSYLEVADDRTWIRIAMHASLEGKGLRRRYFQEFVRQLMTAIVREVRAHLGVADDGPPTPAELEHAWHLHSTLVHYLVRKHIHGDEVMRGHEVLADMAVASFMGGISAGFRAAGETAAEAPRGSRAEIRHQA